MKGPILTLSDRLSCRSYSPWATAKLARDAEPSCSELHDVQDSIRPDQSTVGPLSRQAAGVLLPRDGIDHTLGRGLGCWSICGVESLPANAGESLDGTTLVKSGIDSPNN